MGKSALVAEHAARVRAGGGLALVGGCLDLAGGAVPFLPVVEALGTLPRELGERAWARLVADAPPQLGWLLPGARTAPDLGPVDPLATATARMQVLDLVLDLVRRLAAERPLALIVEDVHWADASTRDLLAFLVRALRARPRAARRDVPRRGRRRRRAPARLAGRARPRPGRDARGARPDGARGPGRAPRRRCWAASRTRRSRPTSTVAAAATRSWPRSSCAPPAPGCRRRCATRCWRGSPRCRRRRRRRALDRRRRRPDRAPPARGGGRAGRRRAAASRSSTRCAARSSSPTRARAAGRSATTCCARPPTTELLPGEREARHRALAVALEADPGRRGHTRRPPRPRSPSTGSPHATRPPPWAPRSAPPRPPRGCAPTPRPTRCSSARWRCGTRSPTPTPWPAPRARRSWRSRPRPRRSPTRSTGRSS